ncbi:MAG: 3-hydroxybutyrate dehydrogenase [Nocardioidaceae bacterium]|nr:3-hydroxybutyrate dehydrogenase [Nocardioidaceae bacterium]
MEAHRSVEGYTALVTGGASGIGEACVRELAARGAKVTVADVDEAATIQLAEQVDGTAWVVDLLDTDSLASVRLDCDILVNNAGIQVVSPIEEFPVESFHRILMLMLEAPFLLTRAALPRMYERAFGRIINVSSVHGLRASKHKAAYVAAKHGLEGLSKVIAVEGGPHGVTSNCVNPAYVRTPLVDKQVSDQARANAIAEEEVVESVFMARNVIKRFVEPVEVARLVAWLASRDADMVTGASYTIDGGFTL